MVSLALKRLVVQIGDAQLPSWICNLQSLGLSRYEESNISHFLVRIVNPSEYNHVAACLSHRQVASCARASIADTN